MSKTKGAPLINEEVLKLITLVEDNPVVFNRATNASNNQLKESAWNKICNSFNAMVSSSPRKPEQLRLKWENLKKTARKRNARIRMNNLKTGGGKAELIPPDEALDRVAAILAPTCVQSPPLRPPTDVHPAVSQTKFIFNRNKSKVKQKQAKQNGEETAMRIRRNLAIAEYYEAKKEEVEIEQKKKQVEYETLLLQKQKLEIEILNLRSKQTDV